MEKAILSTRYEHVNVLMDACVYVGGHVYMCLCACMVYICKCICVGTCLHPHVGSSISTQVLKKFWSTAQGKLEVILVNGGLAPG